MHILLVEDHQSTRSTLERTLCGWGHEVSAAKDLRSGERLLKTERFDAVISDIALPDGSGYALIAQARRGGIDGVAIAISAYPFPAAAYEPDVTGFDYYLNKPCDPDELRALLEGYAWPEVGELAVAGGERVGSRIVPPNRQAVGV